MRSIGFVGRELAWTMSFLNSELPCRPLPPCHAAHRSVLLHSLEAHRTATTALPETPCVVVHDWTAGSWRYAMHGYRECQRTSDRRWR